MVKVCKCTQNPQADEHALGITTCLLVKKEKCFKTFSSASLPLQNVHIHQHEWHSQHKLSSTLPTDRARRPTLLNYWTLVRTYLALNLLFYFPGVCSPVQQYGSLKAKRHFWTQRNMRTITIWFIESKQFQTLLFGLIFLLFFFSLLISFFFCAGASRGRSHDGQRSSGTVLSMHIWRSLFSGAAKSNMFADK